MSEYAPPPAKVRVTKKQLKQVQQNYAKAQELAEDFSEQEALERQKEVEKLEEKIDDVFGSSSKNSKKILIIKNITREGPGILENILKTHQIDYVIIDLDQGDVLPKTGEEFGAVIVLGGPDSANDLTEKIQQELLFVKKLLEKKIPYLGICLGLQILVKAAGGKVIPNQVKEIGFIAPDSQNFNIELSEKGKQDPLFTKLEDTLKVFHLHGETVEITDAMSLLARGKFCENQVVKIDTNAYGLQCHFELTQEMFDNWLREDPDLGKMNQQKIREDFEIIYEEYTKIGNLLFKNFLKIANYI